MMRKGPMINHRSIATMALFLWPAVTAGQSSFVNWESPHVHPLELTTDGDTLLAVNTPDNRIELFDVSTGQPLPLGAIPVGLDPVSVRAVPDAPDEVWVVNHISDSISVVDLSTGNVVATIATLDEPADVVFAGNPLRAFVSCSQANTVLVYDPSNLAAPPVEVPLIGEDPRMMAVSQDGTEVYVAIFESGNRSTILGGGSTLGGGFPPNVVNDPLGPYGGVNPPPNDGSDFNPVQRMGNPPPPAVGLIVKKDEMGRWMDDNNGDWTDLVSGTNADHSGRLQGWDLADHDVAIINTSTLAVDYATGMMNICMALAVHPTTNDLVVVGIDATNGIRFEPILSGRFVRVNVALPTRHCRRRLPSSISTPIWTTRSRRLCRSIVTGRSAIREASSGGPTAIPATLREWVRTM